MGTQSSRSQGLTPARASCIFQTSVSDFDPLLAHSLDDLGPCQPSLVLIYSSGRKRMTEEVKQNSWHAVFAQFLSLPPPPAFSVSLKITWGFIFCGCISAFYQIACSQTIEFQMFTVAYLFIQEAERLGEREGKRNRFHLLVHFPNAGNAGEGPGAGDSSQEYNPGF